MTARPAHRVFLWPAVLGLITLAGLLSALIGDGPWDVLSWAALGVPVAVAVWCWRAGPRFGSPIRSPKN